MRNLSHSPAFSTFCHSLESRVDVPLRAADLEKDQKEAESRILVSRLSSNFVLLSLFIRYLCGVICERFSVWIRCSCHLLGSSSLRSLGEERAGDDMNSSTATKIFLQFRPAIHPQPHQLARFPTLHSLVYDLSVSQLALLT